MKHEDVCKHLGEIYYDKNKRYGNSFAATVEEYGMQSVAIRLMDKINRIKWLVKQPESVERDKALHDALLDTANYSIMGVMEMNSPMR